MDISTKRISGGFRAAVYRGVQHQERSALSVTDRTRKAALMGLLDVLDSYRTPDITEQEADVALAKVKEEIAR